MEWILLIAVIVYFASLVDGSNDAAKRTKRLDPGGRDDFGGKL